MRWLRGPPRGPYRQVNIHSNQFMKNTDNDNQSMLEHVNRTLAANRRPGLHFPAHFLGFHSRGINKAGAELALQYGPHCANVDGSINIAAIAALADMGLSVAMRAHLGEMQRMATLTLHLQFTGATAHNELHAKTRFDGFFREASAIQGRSIGALYSSGELICQASGTFASPPVPAGIKLVPIAWDNAPFAPDRPLLVASHMDATERSSIARAKAALRARSRHGSFIEHFWGQTARRLKSGGASNTVRLGAHTGNRVGHVHGGVLFGMAAGTAVAALPPEYVLTGASAWYVSAGMGDRLHLRSAVLQKGRTIGVVQTRVTDQNRRIVLEMVTSHAHHPARARET